MSGDFLIQFKISTNMHKPFVLIYIASLIPPIYSLFDVVMEA